MKCEANKRLSCWKVGPIVCLKTKEIIYINENTELKDDSLRKKFRSLAQKLREIILKQKVAILSGTPVIFYFIHLTSACDIVLNGA